MKMMQSINEVYADSLRAILNDGEAGSHTTQLFNHFVEYNWQSGFPIISLRKIFLKAAKAETLWMLSGSSDINELGSTKHFWEPWADQKGFVPTSYGRYLVGFPGLDSSWREYGEAGKGLPVNQVKYVLELLKAKPQSRRAVVSFWHPDNAVNSTQPTCHLSLTFNLSIQHGVLHLLVTSRSQDMIMGFPYDVLNYSLLQASIAKVLGVYPGKLSFAIGNAHIYHDHLEVKDRVLGIPAVSSMAYYKTRGPICDYKFDSNAESLKDLVSSLELINPPTEFREFDSKFKLVVNNKVEL